MIEEREIIRADVLDGVPHGFLTGVGHSGEPDPAFVVPGGRLVLVQQVHSPLALAVAAPFTGGPRPEADALVTATPGLVLGIKTADCAPVLLADRAAGVVGAAHAGWRGAHFGVLEATVRRMEELGASRSSINAAIGPTIALENYEVGFDFVEQFEDRHRSFFTRSTPGKWKFDLPAYVRWRLESLHLAKVALIGIDTYADETRFHSYRRATHRGVPDGGRQYSLIALPE
ncbi:peptidoglycan editing factor PgeF [Erythrobacter alti]|uniref:peptidoglycan editing factor PgeF n=1 Tax=Erythrobacter alti TaxID=1896145 RepID=UPI0030F3AE23